MPRGAYGGGHLKPGASRPRPTPMRANLDRLRGKKTQDKYIEVSKKIKKKAAARARWSKKP